MFTNFFNTHPRLVTRLSRAVILLSLGFQVVQASFPPGNYTISVGDTWGDSTVTGSNSLYASVLAGSGKVTQGFYTGVDNLVTSLGSGNVSSVSFASALNLSSTWTSLSTWNPLTTSSFSYTSSYTPTTGTDSGTAGNATVTMTYSPFIFPAGQYSFSITDTWKDTGPVPSGFVGSTPPISHFSTLYTQLPGYGASSSGFYAAIDNAITNLSTGNISGLSFKTVLGSSQNWSLVPGQNSNMFTSATVSGVSTGQTTVQGNATITMTYNSMLPSQPPVVLNIGAGGMLLSNATALGMIPQTSQLMINAAPTIIGSSISMLNLTPAPLVAALANPLIINAALTLPAPTGGVNSGQQQQQPSSVLSTQLGLGAVLRINGITTKLPAATGNAAPGTTGYGNANSSNLSGFSAAFGIPGPIGGLGNPWIIVAPANAPLYPFRAAAIAAGVSGVTVASTLGWADGVVIPPSGTNFPITSAIVIDPTSLQALANASKASMLPVTGTTGAAANGLTQAMLPNSACGLAQAGGGSLQGATLPGSGWAQWNLGVTSCGLSGFSVPAANLQALVAAIIGGGGQVVVASGAAPTMTTSTTGAVTTTTITEPTGVTFT